MDEALRGALVRLIRYKFAGYPNVASLADDIVHDAYLKLRASKGYAQEKENYGYLSVACVRLAYRKFMTQTVDFGHVYIDAGVPLVDESDAAREIIAAADTTAILESLATLRRIERIVINQRYYGNFSFAEIAAANGMKINTILSHHRRALAKLRPTLNKLLQLGKEQHHD